MAADRTKGSGPIVGSGDFLRDRGYLDPEEVRLKFALTIANWLIIEERDLKQSEAAQAAELSQSDVSRIVNGIVKDYSVYRLMRVVTKLGKNVSIDFTETKGGEGAIFAAERGSDYTPEPSR